MSYTPYNDNPSPTNRSTDKDGISIKNIERYVQGIEIRDPLKLRRGIIPKMGMRHPRVDESGFLDNSLEINDFGQDIKASTSAFVDTTERILPANLVNNDIAESFLNELVTQQVIDEKNDGTISVFSTFGIEVPYSLRGTKSSLNGENEYVGTQLVESNYRLLKGLDDFLDGQEEVLGIAVPAIQSTNDQVLLPYDDGRHDDTDRFGINILNQNVNLYDRYASNGFVYGGNSRDSIAYFDLKG
jgi:hypothetical protein